QTDRRSRKGKKRPLRTAKKSQSSRAQMRNRRRKSRVAGVVAVLDAVVVEAVWLNPNLLPRAVRPKIPDRRRALPISPLFCLASLSTNTANQRKKAHRTEANLLLPL